MTTFTKHELKKLKYSHQDAEIRLLATKCLISSDKRKAGYSLFFPRDCQILRDAINLYVLTGKSTKN